MKVYEALARAFIDEGVDTLFSLMGDGNMYWMSSLLPGGAINNVHVRHENAAVAMADGYARSSGRVGVATVTCGPGLTQAGTALVGAVRYRTPMVLFVGDSQAGDTNALQYLDQKAFAAVCGARFEPVTKASTCLDAVQAAFYFAEQLRTPVVLNVPMDIQDEEYPEPYDYIPSRQLSHPSGRMLPDADVLDDAAGLIASSRRPVIIVGNGAVTSGAIPQVLELGERIGALYATSLLAKGSMDESPYSLGVAGTFSGPEAEKRLGDADLVIGVGASLNRFTAQEGYLFPNAKTLQILDRPAAEGAPLRPVSCYLQGDAGKTLTTLMSMLIEGQFESRGYRGLLDGPTRPGPAELDLSAAINFDDGMDPRDLVTALEGWIPPDSIVVCGAGHFWSFPNKTLTGRGNRRFLYSLGFGSIGQAVPVGIGAAVATGRPIVVIEGDSSVLMHIQELDAAARHQLKMLVVVMDDDAMGAELHKLNLRGVPSDAACIPTPDLAAIAAGFGASGVIVRKISEFQHALHAFDWSGVHLIDAKVSQQVVDISAVTGNDPPK